MMALALVTGLAGTGLVAFWFWGLVVGGISGSPEPWPGFKSHELAFAPADILLGLGLLVCAGFTAFGDGAGPLAFVCAGGLLFLGALDFAYAWLTWGQRRGPMRVRTVVLAAAATLLGVTIVLLAA